MPYLPDGSWIDDEQYAEMIAQSSGTGIPTSGTVLGTNYNFMPTTSGGGALNLGWDQTPGFGAAINFDPSAGLENAFISDYDVSGQGMANVGDVSSPNANLSLTAGLQGTGLNAPDPYLQSAVTDVVPGLTVGAGTNQTPFASYFGNQDSVVPGLGITKTSGGPTDVSYATEVVPGVDFNIGTAGGGNVGVRASGAWEDIGKTGRQLWGGITDALGNIISPAGAADEVPAVGTQPLGKYGPSGYTGAGMAEVPSVGSDFFGGGVDAPFDFADDPVEEGEVHDVHRHMGLTMGIWPEEGDYMNMKQQLTNLATQLPAWARKNLVRDRLDTIEQFLDDETTTDKLQDLINNQIAEDTDTAFTNQGLTQAQKYFQAVDNPNVVYDKDSLNAMVALAKKDYYKSEEQVQEAINEIKSGVDTFKDIPAVPAKPAGPTRAELKAAAAAQRKADLADQKAAARRTALARQALKDSQAAATRAAAASAAQAKSEQAKAKAVLAAAAGRDKGGPSQAEINAAIEVMTQVDTFGGGRIGAEGPMSAAEINVAGGMEFGGAGGMAGSDRGSSGRGGPGGRGR